MSADQEARARALELAMRYRGEQAWKMETIMKWADYFYRYIRDGMREDVNT